MLRPSISVWGLTETALQTTEGGEEILVVSGLGEWPFPNRSEVVGVLRAKQWRERAREEQVNELVKEAEAIVGVAGKPQTQTTTFLRIGTQMMFVWVWMSWNGT